MSAERFQCVDCGWEWPYPAEPDDEAECDTCGGEMEPARGVSEVHDG